MELSPDTCAFMARPVTLILGTGGPGFTPDIARGVGLIVSGATLGVLVSEWQWPRAVANIRANSALALTASDPRSYRTYQVKGPARIDMPAPDELALAADYVRRMLDLFQALSMSAGFAGR